MKQKKFKKSFIHLLCMVTMIAGLVLTGFATRSMAAETDTGSGDEGDTEIQNQVVLKISGDIKGGNNLIYLETYNEESGKWVKTIGEESRPENAGYYELTFNVDSGAKFKIINKAASVDINNVTGAVESEGIYTLQDTTATIDILTTVPEGDIWIGDNGYAIGNYTKDTFMALTTDELIPNDYLYIGYDASERTIHDASAIDVKVSFEIITDVKNVVVEDVERVTGSERSTLTFIGLTSSDIGKASTTITGDLSNALNYPKNLKLIGMNFWAKSWEGGSLNIESTSNAVFDTLGDLDKFIVQYGSYAAVGDEERVIPSQGENDEKLISINVNEFQAVYESIVVAPNLSINSNGNVEIGYRSSNDTYSCMLRHVQGKGTLHVTSAGYLDTYTIGDFDSVSVEYSAILSVGDTSNINVEWKNGLNVKNAKIDAQFLKVNVSVGDAVFDTANESRLGYIACKGNMTFTSGSSVTLTAIGNVDGDFLITSASNVTVVDECDITVGSISVESSSSLDAISVKVTSMGDVMCSNSTVSLAAIEKANNLTVTNSSNLNVKYIGNLADVIIKNGSLLTLSDESEHTAIWKSLAADSGGKIDAPNLSLTVTEGVVLKNDTFTLKSITTGGNLEVTSGATLTLTTIGNVGGEFNVNSSSKVTVEKECAATCKSITMQEGGKIEAPNLSLTVTGSALFSYNPCTLKFIATGGNLEVTSGATLTLTTIGNVGGEFNVNSSSKVTVEKECAATCKSFTAQYGGKLESPNLSLTVTDDATFKHNPFTLKALTVGGNLVVAESAELTLKTIGNVGGDVSVKESSKLTVENECTAIWNSVEGNTGGKITAPNLSLTITKNAAFSNNNEFTFKYITVGGDLNISYSGILNVQNIGNIGNIILNPAGKIIVAGTSDDYVTWTSINAQSGSSISAPGMRVKITGNLAAISGVTLTFKELSCKNIQAESGSTITIETIGNMDEINLNYGGILKITGPLNDKLTWKTVLLASGGKIIGLSTKNTDVSINELTITDTHVYMPYISITCDVLNLSGELLANNITCTKFIQTSKAYSYFECNKLTITDLESILYKGVANNIEIVNGDITDVLGERIKPYNITSGYAYTYNETEDKYDVTWGERTGEIIKSNDEINGPVQLFEQYEIKNVSYPEKVIYTGNAVSEPTEEEFQLMNHTRIDSNWDFELTFEWYDANGDLLEELPSECGIYTLRAILDGTKLCLGTSIDVKVVIKKASEVTDIASPVVTDKTCSTIILEAKEGYEYSLDGENWQDSNELKGLENGKEYTIYQRLKETDEYLASEYATITYTFEAGEHEFSDEYTVDRPATSKEDGIKSRHCKHCDEVTDITVIPKLKTGWKNIDGKWYYLDADGVVQTSKWIRTNNKWYYVNVDGEMVISKWIYTNGKWYYLDKDGVMQTSRWIRTNNKWYYLNADGVMQTSKWIKIGRNWYYVNTNGVMQTSKWIAGKYYVKADGTMAVSEWVDNDRYYVGSDGKWIKNYKN